MSEKRKHKRHKVKMPVVISEDPGDKKICSSKTEDASIGGICFHSDHHLNRGANLSIAIPADDHILKIRAKIAYSQKQTSGKYRHGVEFDNEPAEFYERLAEEIVQLESFRLRLERELGRKVTESEAAEKWQD